MPLGTGEAVVHIIDSEPSHHMLVFSMVSVSDADIDTVVVGSDPVHDIVVVVAVVVVETGSELVSAMSSQFPSWVQSRTDDEDIEVVVAEISIAEAEVVVAAETMSAVMVGLIKLINGVGIELVPSHSSSSQPSHPSSPPCR